MNDKPNLNNESFVNMIDSSNERKTVKTKLIKKCHLLEKKYFVVIDESIIDRMNFSDKNDLYFQQELTEDGHIILRRYKMG